MGILAKQQGQNFLSERVCSVLCHGNHLLTILFLLVLLTIVTATKVSGGVLFWEFLLLVFGALALIVYVFLIYNRYSQEASEKLAQVVRQSPMTIVITDTDGNIEYVNPFFTRLTGYQPQEVIGKNPRILNAGEQPKEYYRQLWQEIRQGREWRGEFKNKKKNGDLYWEAASIGSVKDAQGRITHYIAIKEDISWRKDLEETLRKTQQSLEALAIMDPLTGLYNRRGFETLAGQALRIARRNKQPVAVFFVDIDNMKAINDVHGHQSGDASLVEVAGILKSSFRESDIMARLGGDEFVVFGALLGNDSVARILSRLNKLVESRNEKNPERPAILLSVGTAFSKADDLSTVDDLLAQADKAMYVEKWSRKS